MKPLVDRQADLERKMEATSRFQARLMEIWWWLYPRPAELSEDYDQQIKTVLAIEYYARAPLSILSQYVLPLILGLLGAITYLVRRSLFNLAITVIRRASADSSPCACAWAGSLASSAAMFSVDEAELETYSLSTVVVAFLMGYSVEFAFTLFDRLIERGKSLFTPEVRSSETPPRGNTGNQALAVSAPSRMRVRLVDPCEPAFQSVRGQQ